MIYINELGAFILLLSLYPLCIQFFRFNSHLRYVLVARAAKRSSFVFTCSWEHVSNALPQPIIWRAGDVNSDLLQITCGLLQGCTSNKEQNIITWLQASVLHLRRDTDWKHLCKLSWNILLSFQCGGGDFLFFYFFLQAVAVWFIGNYWGAYIF